MSGAIYPRDAASLPLDAERVDGFTTLPGDVLADLVAQKGIFVSIYGWTSNQPGKGGTRLALRALKEFAATVVVHGPGEEGSDSYLYWKKMLSEGLVTQVLGAEDEDLTAAMSANPNAVVGVPATRAPRPR